MPNESFSRHLIRMARRRAGMTQQALAVKAATSQAAISAYEAGRRSPSVETLSRILNAAGFELRMRLAEPDTHPAALAAAEQLVGPSGLAAHNERQRRRLEAHKVDG